MWVVLAIFDENRVVRGLLRMAAEERLRLLGAWLVALKVPLFKLFLSVEALLTSVKFITRLGVKLIFRALAGCKNLRRLLICGR